MSKQTILVPDIGSDDADVIEILVKPGDVIDAEQSIVVLESAKASMEVPCPQGGTVVAVAVTIGQNVKQGDLLLELEVAQSEQAESATPAASPENAPKLSAQEEKAVNSLQQELQAVSQVLTPPGQAVLKTIAVPDIGSDKVDHTPKPSSQVHAGPAVRRLARELGVDLGQVKGSGPKDRILKEDVHSYVKQRMTSPAAAASSSGSGLPALPAIDFAKWGEIERIPLTKIQRLSAQNLHRAWLTIPHVTQFDEADITELEAFRVGQKEAMKKEGLSLTVLSFLVKATAYVLQQYPKFASSLDVDGEHIVQKKYIHIGVAVDTPNGLVVPVIRDADKKSLRDIARDLGELSGKARDKKLSPADMQGAVFSISSLGGIGGTAFTPIVNWPEVAILGVSRSATKPVWDGQAFEPRLMLPLSLSYDHRVIDGADAARFTTALAKVLADIRQLLL